MKIYACGCSFTYGEELKDPAVSSWPALLADKLQSSIVNDAVGGGSNARIVYRTVKSMRDNYDLYLIGWTDYSRYTFYKSDDNIEINFSVSSCTKPLLSGYHEKIYEKWSSDLYKYWYNELYAFKLWLQQIILIQTLFKKENKKYIMVNALPNNLSKWLSRRDDFIQSVKSLINFNSMNDDQIFDEYAEIQYYISLIDTSKFYKWGEFDIMQLCKEFNCGPGNHILEDGHKYLAELIYTHVQNKSPHS